MHKPIVEDLGIGFVCLSGGVYGYVCVCDGEGMIYNGLAYVGEDFFILRRNKSRFLLSKPVSLLWKS